MINNQTCLYRVIVSKKINANAVNLTDEYKNNDNTINANWG